MLQLLDEAKAFDVFFRVPRHVSAGLLPRRQQPLLNVEMNRLPRKSAGLAQVLHPVAPVLVLVVDGSCARRHVCSTRMLLCPRGRPTQVST